MRAIVGGGMGLFTSTYEYYYLWYWYEMECLEKDAVFVKPPRVDQIGEYYMIYEKKGGHRSLVTSKALYEHKKRLEQMEKDPDLKVIRWTKISIEDPRDKLEKIKCKLQ